MARVTVEDCLKIVPNRFELVLIASNRARELQEGAEPIIKLKEKEKNTVVALREIASGKFSEDKMAQLRRVRVRDKKKF